MLEILAEDIAFIEVTGPGMVSNDRDLEEILHLMAFLKGRLLGSRTTKILGDLCEEHPNKKFKSH